MSYTVKTYIKVSDEEREQKTSDVFFLNQDVESRRLELFKIRNEEVELYKKGKSLYICGYCKKPIRICGGRGKNKQSLHFRHYGRDNKECKYENKERLTDEQILRIKYNGAKEGKKHENYKNFVAERLLSIEHPKLSVKDVEVEKVYKDRAISMEWRKPDVMATLPDKKIAFELQFSTTFLSVIAARQEFYREHKIFIFWIFDKFSLEKGQQSFAQLDILVSNNYNVFVLDEEAKKLSIQNNDLYLKCYYITYRNEHGKLSEPIWEFQLISFSQLIYNNEDYKVFAWDTEYKKKEIINEIAKKNSRKEEAEQQQDIHKKKISSFFYLMEGVNRDFDLSVIKNSLSNIKFIELIPRLYSTLDSIENEGAILALRNGENLIAMLLEYYKIVQGSHSFNKLNEYNYRYSLAIVDWIIRKIKESDRIVLGELDEISSVTRNVLVTELNTIVKGFLSNQRAEILKEKISIINILILVYDKLFLIGMKEKMTLLRNIVYEWENNRRLKYIKTKQQIQRWKVIQKVIENKYKKLENKKEEFQIFVNELDKISLSTKSAEMVFDVFCRNEIPSSFCINESKIFYSKCINKISYLNIKQLYGECQKYEQEYGDLYVNSVNAKKNLEQLKKDTETGYAEINGKDFSFVFIVQKGYRDLIYCKSKKYPIFGLEKLSDFDFGNNPDYTYYINIKPIMEKHQNIISNYEYNTMHKIEKVKIDIFAILSRELNALKLSLANQILSLDCKISKSHDLLTDLSFIFKNKMKESGFCSYLNAAFWEGKCGKTIVPCWIFVNRSKYIDGDCLIPRRDNCLLFGELSEDYSYSSGYCNDYDPDTAKSELMDYFEY